MNIETKQNITSVYEGKAQTYDKLIEVAQNLDKESLLQLFTRLVTDIKETDIEFCNQTKNSNDSKLALEQAKIIAAHINHVDTFTDQIIIQQNQKNEPVISENAIPGNILQ